MNMQTSNQKLKKIKFKTKRSNSLSHCFVTDKLNWKKLHCKMNSIDKSKNNSSIMSTRQEFIIAMEKLAKVMIQQVLDMPNPTKEQIRKVAISEDFNEMVYEALLYKDELSKSNK